jgi:hypothetical protein
MRACCETLPLGHSATLPQQYGLPPCPPLHDVERGDLPSYPLTALPPYRLPTPSTHPDRYLTFNQFWQGRVPFTRLRIASSAVTDRRQVIRSGDGMAVVISFETACRIAPSPKVRSLP